MEIVYKRSVTTDHSMPVIQMRKLRLEKHQTWFWRKTQSIYQ